MVVVVVVVMVMMMTAMTIMTMVTTSMMMAGHKIYVVGGTTLETGQQVRVAEYFDTRTGLWEEDFNFRKGHYLTLICFRVFSCLCLSLAVSVFAIV